MKTADTEYNTRLKHFPCSNPTCGTQIKVLGALKEGAWQMPPSATIYQHTMSDGKTICPMQGSYVMTEGGFGQKSNKF